MLNSVFVLEAVPYPHLYTSQNRKNNQQCVLYPMANVGGEGKGKFSVGPRGRTRVTQYVCLEQLAELFAIDGFTELELGVRMAPMDKKNYPGGAPPRLQPRRNHVSVGSPFEALVECKRHAIAETGISEGLAAVLASMNIPLPQHYRPRSAPVTNSGAPVGELAAQAGDAQGEVGARRRAMTLTELQRKLARNEEIGAVGQNIAYAYECQRLANLGCPEPARHVHKTYNFDVGAGYDLESEFAGERRCIEVKASTADPRSFFLSENERKVLMALGSTAWLYLVQVNQDDVSASHVIAEIADPIPRLELEPAAYRAHIRFMEPHRADEEGGSILSAPA